MVEPNSYPIYEIPERYIKNSCCSYGKGFCVSVPLKLEVILVKEGEIEKLTKP